jgi:DNA-binding response OmpR family regulator
VLFAVGENDGLDQVANCDPDVVMLDLGLATGDGRAVLQVLKTTTRTSWIPVIVASGRVDPEAVAEILDLGAQDYVLKPWQVGDLVQRLAAALRVAADRRP